jgi:hypothetical protein
VLASPTGQPMTDASSESPKPARRTCPYCGERLTVGFGDFLPTRGRGGPVRVTCSSCRGIARLAASSQIMGVVGFMLGLLGGAVVGARFAAAQSDQTTLLVLAIAIAGGFFLSFTLGYAFIRFDPDVAPPAPKSRASRSKGGKGRKN